MCMTYSDLRSFLNNIYESSLLNQPCKLFRSSFLNFFVCFYHKEKNIAFSKYALCVTDLVARQHYGYVSITDLFSAHGAVVRTVNSTIMQLHRFTVLIGVLLPSKQK